MLVIVCVIRVRHTENPIRVYYPARCDALMLHVCHGSPLPLTPGARCATITEPVTPQCRLLSTEPHLRSLLLLAASI